MTKPIVEIKNVYKRYSYSKSETYSLLSDKIRAYIKDLPHAFSDKEKTIKYFWALDGISFAAYPGETIGIIGPNGAGKSTLLKMLSRITPPTRGEIIMNGKVTSLLEVGTGFNPELTGRENIYLNGALLGMNRKEIGSKFTQIVDFAEIKKFLDTPVKHYSSGMYMRLAFSIASHLDQDILLLDEVLAVGDFKFQKKSLKKMEEITRDKRKTIFFVSHDMGAIQNLCTRCVYIDNGKIKKIGNPTSVVNSYLKTSTSYGHIPLTKRSDRKGSGKIRFTNIYLKNSLGRETRYFRSGEDIEIWFEYEIFEKIKELYFGLGIDNFSEQTRVAFISNKITNETIDIKKKMFKIKIKNLALTSGTYSMTILGHDQFIEVLDWVVQAGVFTVEHGNFYATGKLPPQHEGSVLLNYKFE